MVLTKEQLDDQDWWNKNIVFVERIPADGEETLFLFFVFPSSFLDISYETLLSVFVGSYYVDVRTLSEVVPKVVSEDLDKIRDAFGKYNPY